MEGKTHTHTLFAAISSVQSNLGVDSIAPARRSLKKDYWSFGPRPTNRGDGEGRGLSTKSPYAANANE